MLSNNKFLSEIPFEEIQIGDKLISANRTKGKIINLIPIDNASQKEDNEIVIDWENGNRSHCWHFWCDKVIYLGRD